MSHKIFHLMCTSQKYEGRGNSAQNSTPAVNSDPQTPVTGNEWQDSDLQDYLQDPQTRHNARLMVRAWFLSHQLQEEGEAVLNPCGNRVNTYLFELLDSFLSQPVAGEGVNNG